ncbi:curli production assembly/transport component CsgG [Rhodoblastus acidophilus]|uniref:CsgG/HfaB family protein n=1 Tax=Rhodoblastus acidophilus TaxID=1074 RepID=UPI0022254344|nr:CsgG/HfaB family protein [Rhodoblastus acidophilus]MCW2318761.1 curli production assembly/transport component CsgG [Rhodoblastus acidophilus]
MKILPSRMHAALQTGVALLAVGLLAGCAQPSSLDILEQPPIVTPPSQTGVNLETLPPAARKIDIAVYQFPDLTGKNEPNDTVAVFSRAVTQGGSGLIIDALKRAGGGRWFTVVERTGLNDLLQERQLVRATRQEFFKDAAKPLPPIRFAGLLVQGGILTYDANTMTGGLGANFLGIGANTQYRRDMVTVGVRIVSVQSGEVLTSVTTTKTVYSAGVSANVYKYVSVDKILQAETGVTRNEPTQLAVRQAIDLAVYATVMEGARAGIWTFADPKLGAVLTQQYVERDKPGEALVTATPGGAAGG